MGDRHPRRDSPPARRRDKRLSYKAILVGILLLLAVPAVSSAQVIFQASFSGTEYCHSKVTKIKGTLFINFLSDGMIIANDPIGKEVIAALHLSELFATGASSGACAFTQDDADGFGIFAGTFNGSGDPTGFTGLTGTLSEEFSDGCSNVVTIKLGKRIL